MGTEEKEGTEMYPKNSIPENQRENAGSQERNYERKPAYHATRDGSGYQAYDSDRPSTAGRRPRIKDSRNVNYNRIPYGGGDYRTGDNRETGRYNYPPQSSGGMEERRSYPPQSSGMDERRSYPPQSSGDERRPYPPQSSGMDERRPYQQSSRPAHPYGGSGERREYQPRSPRPDMDRGYQKRERVGGYEGNRPPYAHSGRPGGVRPGEKGPNRRPPQRPYNPNAKYSYQKQLKYKEALTDPNEPIRLNKFLANAGVCSRREADEFIQAGVVKVNGNVITELGTKITRQDAVLFHDRQVQIEGKLYILLNKPKNCVTSSDDPQERRTVMDLVRHACKERIYPVGRLDRNTTGVLLLTNDGDLASKLTHPSYKKKKIYHVWIDREVAVEDMEKLATGIELDDGEIHADAVSYADESDKKQVGIEIHSGRNRIVRRMFEALGYRVARLDRVYFAGLTKKNLGRGKWRYLNEKEVNMLRMGAFE
ncbi:MAG: RNA-binding S4 domain-containing protein [Tannerella sp.]|jgi:23S rRNA pseudouridine2605 synthase|nr:RNA-binding S4 domain-containing protein [Tannerella sp.]